jgi:outer membrane receptor protein involved in Fe transport
LGVDWTPDSDTLVYGKYNRGYKPGGLGCAATFCVQTPLPYTDRELVDAFEVGFKRDWRDWNLTTNAVFFYYDYQGYQVSNTIVPDDPDGFACRCLNGARIARDGRWLRPSAAPRSGPQGA